MLIFLYALPNFNFQDKREFVRMVKKEYRMEANGTTAIYNKYGKVDVKTWDRDRVRIEVSIRVRATTEDNAQEVFDRIQIDFTNRPDLVKAQTEINGRGGSWWNWGSNSDDFNIDYEVFLPRSSKLDLQNSYGDAVVDPLGGDVRTDIKYGNLMLKGVGGKLNLALGYGNANVLEARDLKADLSYCKFTLNAARDIHLMSKYSKVNVGPARNVDIESSYDKYDIREARSIHIQGRYDNYTIGQVGAISGTAKYSEFKVGELVDSGNFNLEYGGAYVGKVTKGFDRIVLVGKYTDFKLNVEEGAAYTLDAKADYAGIRYPQAMKVNHVSDHGTSQSVDGFMEIQNARSLIEARLDYGGLKID